MDRLFLRVEKIIANNREKPIRGNLRISVPHTETVIAPLDLHASDMIKVSAKLSASQGTNNFCPSTLERYLKGQNIHNRAYTKNSMLVEKLKSGRGTSILRIFSTSKSSIGGALGPHLSRATTWQTAERNEPRRKSARSEIGNGHSGRC